MRKAAISGRPLSSFELFSCEVVYAPFTFGLPALRAFDHVKLHLLTFLQAAEAARLNGREVHKYVPRRFGG